MCHKYIASLFVVYMKSVAKINRFYDIVELKVRKKHIRIIFKQIFLCKSKINNHMICNDDTLLCTREVSGTDLIFNKKGSANKKKRKRRTCHNGF